mmetsp:Transcript_30133/g.76772  ORF Transcript_30133/g.76772 Transcript_30133/m.76772 type:complete len:207 (-) Transcript_30133:1961-2581(-)
MSLRHMHPMHAAHAPHAPNKHAQPACTKCGASQPAGHHCAPSCLTSHSTKALSLRAAAAASPCHPYTTICWDTLSTPEPATAQHSHVAFRLVPARGSCWPPVPQPPPDSASQSPTQQPPPQLSCSWFAPLLCSPPPSSQQPVPVSNAPEFGAANPMALPPASGRTHQPRQQLAPLLLPPHPKCYASKNPRRPLSVLNPALIQHPPQ